MANRNNPIRLLAISSGGGHWNELYRLKSAFDGCEVTWCSTHGDYAAAIAGRTNPRGEQQKYFTVTEANRWRKWAMAQQLAQIFMVVLKTRPNAVVSTGSSVGFFGILFSKLLFGARTVWVQSLADTDGMSMSGTLVRPFATLWLTQWEHQSRPDGPHYFGSVL